MKTHLGISKAAACQRSGCQSVTESYFMKSPKWLSLQYCPGLNRNVHAKTAMCEDTVYVHIYPHAHIFKPLFHVFGSDRGWYLLPPTAASCCTHGRHLVLTMHYFHPLNSGNLWPKNGIQYQGKGFCSKVYSIPNSHCQGELKLCTMYSQNFCYF